MKENPSKRWKQNGNRSDGETGGLLFWQCLMRSSTGTSTPSTLRVRLMTDKNHQKPLLDEPEKSLLSLFLFHHCRLDFRRSLVSCPRSSPRKLLGKRAGSFPERRLEMEPTRSLLSLAAFKHGAILYNEAEVFSLSITNPNGRPMLPFYWLIHSSLILASCHRILFLCRFSAAEKWIWKLKFVKKYKQSAKVIYFI